MTSTGVTQKISDAVTLALRQSLTCACILVDDKLTADFPEDFKFTKVCNCKMSQNINDDEVDIHMECSTPIPSEERMEESREESTSASGTIAIIAVRGNLAHEFEPLAPAGEIQRENERRNELEIYRGRRENLDW